MRRNRVLMMSTGGCKIIRRLMSSWGESDNSSPLFINNDCAKYNLAWGYTSTGLALIWSNSSDRCVTLCHLFSGFGMFWKLQLHRWHSLTLKSRSCRAASRQQPKRWIKRLAGACRASPYIFIYNIYLIIFTWVLEVPWNRVINYFERSWASRILQNLADAVKDDICSDALVLSYFACFPAWAV